MASVSQSKKVSPSDSSQGTVSNFSEEMMSSYRAMLLARVLEERLAGLYRAGGRIVGGVYLGKGQEAFSSALATFLQSGKDVYGPLIRDQAGRIAFGQPVLDTVRTYFGSAQGPMRARDGNVHWGKPRDGVPAMISHLGSLMSVVSGMLFAKRMKGQSGMVGATCSGDGATSTGAFHEGLNQAAVEGLPLVVAVANNQFAYSTSNDRQFACDNLVDRAKGYGIDGYEVNGTDLKACLEVFKKAVDRAREGGGPQLIIGNLLRLAGHGEHDDCSYISEDLKGSELGRDCLDIAKEQLIEMKLINEKEASDWRERCINEVEEAVEQAFDEAGPDPYSTEWRAVASKHLVEEFSLLP